MPTVINLIHDIPNCTCMALYLDDVVGFPIFLLIAGALFDDVWGLACQVKHIDSVDGDGVEGLGR